MILLYFCVDLHSRVANIRNFIGKPTSFSKQISPSEGVKKLTIFALFGRRQSGTAPRCRKPLRAKRLIDSRGRRRSGFCSTARQGGQTAGRTAPVPKSVPEVCHCAPLCVYLPHDSIPYQTSCQRTDGRGEPRPLLETRRGEHPLPKCPSQP